MTIFLAAADVFVFLSRWEGHPVPALEAMAAGTAVAASAIESNKELMPGGEFGILVPVEDAVSLAEGLMRIVADADCRARYASVAQAYVRDAFSPERIAR